MEMKIANRVEEIILRSLIYDDAFLRTCLPFLKDDYFDDDSEKLIFKTIIDYSLKYNKAPSPEAIGIEINALTGINERTFKESNDLIKEIKSFNKSDTPDLDWLLDTTENFCQERAIYNAVREAIGILDANSKSGKTKGAIPEILSDALAVSFDTNVGHDYLENFEERYEYLHRVEEKISFDLDCLNKITRGGVSRKTLNLLQAGTGIGKTLAMCHMAAHNLSDGKNVLYITLEMSEEEIAKRIDANLLDTTIDDLMLISKELYAKKVTKLKAKVPGKLIIKQYPTAAANSLHFETLLNELLLKKKFKPDIIYIDYLNICSSSRVKPGGNVNTYTYIKSVTEEIRGLAIKFNLPIISATQSNRAGNVDSDPDVTTISDSFGTGMTVDFWLVLTQDEDLAALCQIMVKQLKNRYDDLNKMRRFVIGVDKAKQRLYDVTAKAQEDIVDDTRKPIGQISKEKFKGFEI